MKINAAGSGHAGHVKIGDAEWLPYDAKLDKQKKCLEKAIEICKNNIRGSKTCNDAFTKLPGGRSFDSIFDDNSVWISYCPDKTVYGYTIISGVDISICEYAYMWGLWSVVGTLVHEMGHVNGAGTTDHAAEGTLLSCGLAKVHDPTIIGNRETVPIYIA
jgi:hypothetical protein